METMDMHDLFNDQPEGSGGAEGELDEVKTSSYRKENEGEKHKRRKEQLNRLYVIGKFNYIKEFISRLDITKYKLTFDGTEVGYIDTGGAYRMSGNKKNSGSVTKFRKQYEKALVEHKKKFRSVIEEETQGEASGANVEDIYEDDVEELQREVTVQGDDLVEQAKKLQDEGKIAEQERREFAGVTLPKGPPEDKIQHVNMLMKDWKNNMESNTDADRRRITENAVGVAKRVIDNAELEMGRVPHSESKTSL
ncbi:Hypothetical predicted protein [Paramuricea clavata]|uniref:Uncharacterized protein n=1 Tax=Paramuricea clavata TaxID=317549 RepID=A0A6S7J5M6_PARCT|nr:Hypothetical predicted protein [Paramuricea clavata]